MILRDCTFLGLCRQNASEARFCRHLINSQKTINMDENTQELTQSKMISETVKSTSRIISISRGAFYCTFQGLGKNNLIIYANYSNNHNKNMLK